MCQIALPTSGERDTRLNAWTERASLNVYHTSSLAARLLLSTFSASAVGIIRQIRLYIQRYLRTQKRVSHQSWNAETWIFQWNAPNQYDIFTHAANHTSTYIIQIRTEVNGYIKSMQTTTIKTTSDYRETCTLTTARNPVTYSFIAKSK
jgi:hypothetical protein